MNIVDWQIMSNGLSAEINNGIILYGASGAGKKLLEFLSDLGLNNKVLAVIDSDDKKWGENLIQYKISSFEILTTISNNAIIVIASSYFNEIKEFLQYKVQCLQRICNSFALKIAIHYDIMNNKAGYIKNDFIKDYIKKYNLWKNISELKKVSEYQKIFFNMATYIMERPVSILLCGIQKTGNVSLSLSFNSANDFTNAVFTGHSSYFDEFTLEKIKRIVKIFSYHNIKIISGVREPIERIISQKWQNIDQPFRYNDTCMSVLIDNNYNDYVDNKKKVIIKPGFRFYKDVTNFFYDHIEQIFGIDVFKYPFDKEKGYSVIKKNNISVFVYRLDKLSNLEKEIGEFAGDSSFSLKKANDATEKKYAFAYAQYLELVKVKKDFFDSLVNSKGMTHFYTEEECKKYREKWDDRIV